MQTSEDAIGRIVMAMGELVRAVRRQPIGEGDQGTFWVLAGLMDGPLRPTALAERVMLDASTVSRHVDTLSRLGYVERQPDPADGRARLVSLTPEGREVVQRGKARRRAAVVGELETWSPEELETLERLTLRLRDNVMSTLQQEEACR